MNLAGKDFFKLKISSVTRAGFRILFGCATWFSLALLLFVVVQYILIPNVDILHVEREAYAGNHRAQTELGCTYAGYTGRPFVYIGRFAEDRKKAVYWLEIAAKAGEQGAIVMLPRILEREFPGERNSEVVHWYAESAKQDDADATKRLIDIYTHGQLGQPRDPKKVLYWNAVRAKQLRNDALESLQNSAGTEGGGGRGGGIGGGSPKAAQALKDIYTYGKLGKSRDPKAVAYWEIVRWQDTVANISDEQKATNAYGNGETVKILKEAATLGDIEAAKELVDIYKYGQLDQPRNAKEAARWETVRTTGRKAASQE